MLALLLSLTVAPAHEGHAHHPHVAEEPAPPERAPVYGIDVPRPQATLEWFEGEEVHGDGWMVELWFYARGVEGRPIPDLDLYLSATAGELGPLVNHGHGVYSVAYTPPEINHWAEVIIRARGITEEEEGVYMEHTLWVLPPEGPQLVREREPRERPRFRTTDAPAIVTSKR